jgi:hypothetical protein
MGRIQELASNRAGLLIVGVIWGDADADITHSLAEQFSVDQRGMVRDFVFC